MLDNVSTMLYEISLNSPCYFDRKSTRSGKRKKAINKERQTKRRRIMKLILEEAGHEARKLGHEAITLKHNQTLRHTHVKK
eukprot:4687783-Amphidinium_carterae.1